MHNILVFLSPLLLAQNTISYDNKTVVVIDVLRATSSFCSAFDSGAKAIYPVKDIEILKNFKNQGMIIAAEKGGDKVDFADFGNSPIKFLENNLENKSIAYSTTNGTKAIEMVKDSQFLITACFNNIDVATDFILKQDNDIILLCSGWQNNVCIEDTLCAGMIISKLFEKKQNYNLTNDSAIMAYNFWNNNAEKYQELIKLSEHYKRLLSKNLNDDLDYCLKVNTSNSLPYWNGSFLENYK